jgi:nuclease S1
VSKAIAMRDADSGLRGHPGRIRVMLMLAVTWSGVDGAARPAPAWGRMGHRASARLAEARLTPVARAAIRDLLEPGESLADASTWADEHRRDVPESGSWHYVHVPITEPSYDARFCAEAGCIVSKIAEFRRLLADRNAARADRQKALRFLVHLVQDIHQPLHVGDRGDRGGNDLQLQFFGRGSNLHRIWDSGLLEHGHEHEAALFRHLDATTTPELAGRWTQGTVVDWANESLASARRAYRLPRTDAELRPGMRLGREYEDVHLPVARLRVKQSGVRLAAMLNGIFR